MTLTEYLKQQELTLCQVQDNKLYLSLNITLSNNEIKYLNLSINNCPGFLLDQLLHQKLYYFYIVRMMFKIFKFNLIPQPNI